MAGPQRDFNQKLWSRRQNAVHSVGRCELDEVLRLICASRRIPCFLNHCGPDIYIGTSTNGLEAYLLNIKTQDELPRRDRTAYEQY